MSGVLQKFRNNNFGFIEIISRLINWGCLPVVALLSEPEIFGQIVLAYSYIIVVTVLGGFGQQRSILMYAHNDDSVVFNANLLSLSATTIVCLTTIILFDISVIILPIVLLNVLINNLVNVARSKGDFFNFTIYRIGIALSRFLLIITFLSIELSITVYLYAELVSALLVIVIGFLFKPLTQNKTPSVININKIVALFTFGLPLFLQAGVAQITQVGDRFIVSSNLGESALATYFFISVFCSSVAFVFAFNAQKYEVKIYRASDLYEAKRNTNKFCIKSLKYSLIFYFFSLTIYSTVTHFGDKYEFDFLLMTSLFINSSLFVFSVALNYYLSYLGKNRYIFLFSASNALIFIFAVSSLIARFGLYAIPLVGFMINITFLVVYYACIIKQEGLFDK